MDKSFQIRRPSSTDKAIELQTQAVEALTPLQRDKLKELKQIIRITKVPYQNHEDYFLLRWLKVANFDVKSAEKMLESYLSFREQWCVEEMPDSHKSHEVVLKYYPLTNLGNDKDGLPIWLLLFGRFDMKGLLHSCSQDDFLKHIIYMMEFSEYEYVIQTEKCGAIVDKHQIIVDLDQFDFKSSLWKPGLETIYKIMNIYESKYPKTLKCGIMINAPKIFTIFYAIVKPFFSEHTRNSIKIYGRDGWQDELRNLMNPDILPKNWGGDAVDAVDGNPYCSSRISLGGKIPESIYSAQLFLDQQKFDTTIVPKMEKFKVDLQVVQPNSSITWTFKTEKNDIGFGIKFKSNSPNSASKYVKEVERVTAERIPEDGALLCEELGTYTLVFDNSFSWISNKTLFYSVELLSPEVS